MQKNLDGSAAEHKVAEYLAGIGYKIVDRNWKTKQCEIDIVARKDNCVHFVEVKYRSTPDQGGGFEYVTRTKIKQMEFAAKYWVSVHDWTGEFVLSAASVSGDDFEIEYIEHI